MDHVSPTMNLSFEDAIDAVTAALGDEGFGVFACVDMHTTFKTKLGADKAPYTILGACNPKLAHTAVTAVPEIGLLLPCNVTVEADGNTTRIRIPNAREMLGGAGLSDASELAELAEDAGQRLERVATALEG